MKISYNKLWKLLIDRNIKKGEWKNISRTYKKWKICWGYTFHNG